jgi:hypothetical protein
MRHVVSLEYFVPPRWLRFAKSFFKLLVRTERRLRLSYRLDFFSERIHLTDVASQTLDHVCYVARVKHFSLSAERTKELGWIFMQPRYSIAAMARGFVCN